MSTVNKYLIIHIKYLNRDNMNLPIGKKNFEM